MTVLEWKPPPAPFPARHLIIGPDTVEELRARPGEWAVVKRWPYRQNHSKKPKRPADIEVLLTKEGDQLVLYARAIPPR